MNEYSVLKTRIMELVATSKNQRVRPNDAKQILSLELDISPFTINKAMEELVEEENLVYVYRDPCSYVEIPCNGCDGKHHAARPMQVVTDSNGNNWLCDKDINPNGDLEAQGCWRCEDIAFPIGR